MNFAELKHRLETHPAKDLGRGATAAQILEAEAELGVRLQEGYGEFLRAFGWGGVEDFELYGLGPDVPRHLDLIRVTKSERTEAHPPLPETLIPLRNDGGGNLYCLDAAEPYRKEYPVVFWDHEAAADQDPDLVADNFVAWLSELLDTREG